MKETEIRRFDSHSEPTGDAICVGEIQPREHLVQIYDDDATLNATLAHFADVGLSFGEAVIIIATPQHRATLAQQLARCGHDLAAAIARDQYIALDARATLATFLRDDTIDADAFRFTVSELLDRAAGSRVSAPCRRFYDAGQQHRDSNEQARDSGRHIRAFGEMVALLWKDGLTDAAIELEHLWHDLCHERDFALLCAYPREHFDVQSDVAAREVCAAHTRVIAG